MSIETRYIPSYEQKAEQNALLTRQNEILEGIWKNIDPSTKQFNVATFDYVADIIQMDRAREFFNAGDAFFVNHDIFSPQYWQILGINSGDIYNPEYTGDILVEDMKFNSTSGSRNDFDLKYKRYKNSTDLTKPLDGDVTEVRMIETSGTNFSYNSSTGALTFSTALPKNTICYLIGKINNVEYRTTIFGDGTTKTFDIEITVNNQPSPLDSINQIIYVTEDYEYNESGTIHIGASNNEIPFGDSVEVDVQTTKPSVAIQTVDCLNTAFQFSKNNSNFYHTSNIRQFLNSYGKKGKWFQKMSSSDTEPNWATTQNGFLEGLDKGLLKHIKKCRKLTSLPRSKRTLYDGATSIYSTERIFLLSLIEANAGLNDGISEGRTYDFYNQFSGEELNAARIKKVGTNNNNWWLRSPFIFDGGSDFDEFNITTAGVETHAYSASNTERGIAPACIIG